MEIVTLAVNTESLREYSTIPISFQVRSTLAVVLLSEGLGGIRLDQEAVVPAYVKDYDEAKGEGPMRWLERFDTSSWVLFIALKEGARLGGATVAYRTPAVRMLRGRDDIAILWDIRVHPDHRRRGLGTTLFSEAVAWCEQRNCQYLEVETQNVNVPACRFYIRQGCRLGELDNFAYPEPELAHEVRLVWHLDLPQPAVPEP